MERLGKRIDGDVQGCPDYGEYGTDSCKSGAGASFGHGFSSCGRAGRAGQGRRAVWCARWAVRTPMSSAQAAAAGPACGQPSRTMAAAVAAPAACARRSVANAHCCRALPGLRNSAELIVDRDHPKAGRGKAVDNDRGTHPSRVAQGDVRRRLAELRKVRPGRIMDIGTADGPHGV